ncbi:potassium-transporting ATPase subunit KdpC [Streptantibioticus ferralitis]|uniref:Potassium-transporting ATPase KdpC subunit n=1 Tax=Streptantibioticus ferralitis TaxID=236510 RepID=A0ABT5YTY8_9ACTN|nr:potassium-transporting ATPase subunit KdpC [Streptantibioticus ferralitis]MDF2255055.1 potassium-transporting ATPase subunit KdpC [Streptantibioticus ferralitis]
MAGSLARTARHHLAALRMLVVFTVITGLAYPLAVTGIAQLAFSHHANGSVIRDGGRPVASSLIGQKFNLPPPKGRTTGAPDPRWFQPRPSAGGYDPAKSGASNLGPNNAGLAKAVTDRRAAVAAFDGVPPSSVPADAITASGSGLDPDISPAYAYEQVNRVAKARAAPPSAVRKLVADHVQGRTLGFLGQEHVNVVALNRALTALK